MQRYVCRAIWKKSWPPKDVWPGAGICQKPLEQGRDILSLMLNNLALQGLDISTRKGALAAIEALGRAIAHITTAQAKLGALENRFTHNLNNLYSAIRHSATAYGRVIDTDFAKASTALARQKILQQASSDMLVKANDNQRLVLQLLEVM